MNDGAEIIFDNIIKKMDDETKNKLIKTLMTHNKEDVWIQTIPIYEDICHEGHIIMRYIKDVKYAISVKHDIDNLIEKEYYAIWLSKEEDKES